jgi:hypothetical protein
MPPNVMCSSWPKTLGMRTWWRTSTEQENSDYFKKHLEVATGTRSLWHCHRRFKDVQSKPSQTLSHLDTWKKVRLSGCLKTGAPTDVFDWFTLEIRRQDAIMVVSPEPVPLFGIYQASQDTEGQYSITIPSNLVSHNSGSLIEIHTRLRPSFCQAMPLWYPNLVRIL